MQEASDTNPPALPAGTMPAWAAGWADAHRASDQEATRPHWPAHPGWRRAGHHHAGPVVRHRCVLEAPGRVVRQRVNAAART